MLTRQVTKNKKVGRSSIKPIWTQEQLDLLYEKYGLVEDTQLAKKLGRTVLAIREKAARLGMVRTQGFMTVSDVSRILNVSPNTVKNWIKNSALNATKSPVGVGRHKVWHIDHDDLVRFVKMRYDLFDPYKIDRQLNPYWRNLVEKVLPNDFTPANGRHWTEFEDAYLLNNRSKYTTPELAKSLRRTKEAVHGRLVLLRRQGRMMPYKKLWQTRKVNGTATAARKWTAEEICYLVEHWGQLRDTAGGGTTNRNAWGSHYTAKEIAAHLGRTEHACWTRASRLGLLNENWTPLKKRNQEGKEYVA
jgi:DNA-binding CsgD family transcriptional regulator